MDVRSNVGRRQLSLDHEKVLDTLRDILRRFRRSGSEDGLQGDLERLEDKFEPTLKSDFSAMYETIKDLIGKLATEAGDIDGEVDRIQRELDGRETQWARSSTRRRKPPSKT